MACFLTGFLKVNIWDELLKEGKGLQYRNRHRYYDPLIGSYISQDPLGLTAGENVYGFGSNVQKWIDPLGLACEASLPKRTKQNGKFTEPELPPKTIIEENGVTIQYYVRSGDHGPAHLHVKGGGPETKIGQSGKPIDGSPELTTQQRAIIDANKKTIKKSIDKIQRWWRFENKY